MDETTLSKVEKNLDAAISYAISWEAGIGAAPAFGAGHLLPQVSVTGGRTGRYFRRAPEKARHDFALDTL